MPNLRIYCFSYISPKHDMWRVNLESGNLGWTFYTVFQCFMEWSIDEIIKSVISKIVSCSTSLMNKSHHMSMKGVVRRLSFVLRGHKHNQILYHYSGWTVAQMKSKRTGTPGKAYETILQKQSLSHVYRHEWHVIIIHMEQTKKLRANHHWVTQSLHEVLCERRPTTSPVFRHVLVRPGISAYGSELCSSFLPPTPRKPKAASRHSNMDHCEQWALLPARRNARWLTAGSTSWASLYCAHAR